MDHEHVVVLDNGGSCCKIGMAGSAEPYRVFPNAVGRSKGERQSFVGEQIVSYPDASSLSLKRPFDRGYLVSWDVEKPVWWRAFKVMLQQQPQDCGLLMTEAPFCLPSIQTSTMQMVFEEFGFRSFLAMPEQPLSLLDWQAQRPSLPANTAGIGVVVDAGFSFTHAVPMCDGRALPSAVRRINVGGKALTNYFKELVSYRSINMMEETYLVDNIKEQVCFISTDLRADLAAARKGTHKLEYVLPDGVNERIGYARQPLGKGERAEKNSKEQVLVLNKGRIRVLEVLFGPRISAWGREASQAKVLALNNERFMVPEVLFQPSDIGLQQGGLAQAVAEAVEATPPDLHPLLYSNVVCTGGCSTCPGFRERLYNELRALVPDDFEVGVHAPSDPVLAAWKGGSRLAASPLYQQRAITKQQYAEYGAANLVHRHPDIG